MNPRRTALTTVAALALLGGVGTSVSHASPLRADRALLPVKGKPTTDRYVVKLIAKIAPTPGVIMVSSNGKWAITHAGITEDTTFKTQLIDVVKGKVIGTLNGTAHGERGFGVDNAGIVYGSGVAPNTEYGFSWNGHTLIQDPLPGSWVNCSEHAPSDVALQFNSVNAFGDVVGAAFWSCPSPQTGGGAEAISVTPQNGIEVSGTYTENDTKYHPSTGFTIDDDGIISGDVGGPSDPESEWTDSAVAVPQLIAPSVGESAVWPSKSNALWFDGDFVGSDVSVALNAPQTLFDGAKHADIPDTTGEGQSPAPFAPMALGSKGLVVGTLTNATTSATSPAVWSAGASVTPLTSLLAAPTKDHLETAMAIDTNGDIFGTATTSTAKGAPQYLYEAVPGHPAPSVSLETPKSGKTYKKDASLKASYTCKAAKGETLRSCKGSVADHHAVSTKKVGKHAFTVVATDTDGQQTKKTVHFTVKA